MSNLKVRKTHHLAPHPLFPGGFTRATIRSFEIRLRISAEAHKTTKSTESPVRHNVGVEDVRQSCNTGSQGPRMRSFHMVRSGSESPVCVSVSKVSARRNKKAEKNGEKTESSPLTPGLSDAAANRLRLSCESSEQPSGF